MPKPAVTAADLRARRKRQDEWREFRKEALFTQTKLAERLEVSVRTVQNVEAGKFTPVPSTLRHFEALKAMFGRNGRRAA